MGRSYDLTSSERSIGAFLTRTPAARETAFARAAVPGIAGGSPTPLAPSGPTGEGTSIRRALHSDAAVDDVEVLGRCLELFGRDLEQLAACFLGGFVDRAADAVGDLAAARGGAEWSIRRVRGLDTNLVRRDPESLGGDQRETRCGAADVGRTYRDRDGSVWFDAATGGRRRPRAAPRTKRHADCLVVANWSCVKGMRLHCLEHLHRPDPRPLIAVRGRVPFTRDVKETQLDGVDVQREGQLVHRRLEGEESLRRARGPVRVDRRLVGRDL